MKKPMILCLLGWMGAIGCGAIVPTEPGSTGGATSATTIICEPGATRECFGPGACNGAQACDITGSYWGDCDCGTGTGGAPDMTETGGAPSCSLCGAGGAPSIGGTYATGGWQSTSGGGVGNEEDGLAIWSRLGSIDEVIHTEVGPDFSVSDLSLIEFVSGVDGNALATLGGGVGGGGYLTMNQTDFMGSDPTRGTIEAWVQKRIPKAIAFGTPLISLVGCQVYSPETDNVMICAFWSDGYTGNGGLEFEIRQPNGGAAHVINDLGWDAVPVGQWVHVAFVWDYAGIAGTADTQRIYRDGNLVASTTEPVSEVPPLDPLVHIMGNHNFSRLGEPMLYMDELKVWRKAKTTFSATTSGTGGTSATGGTGGTSATSGTGGTSAISATGGTSASTGGATSMLDTGPHSLVLWNKLGSDDELTHSEVGVNGGRLSHPSNANAWSAVYGEGKFGGGIVRSRVEGTSTPNEFFYFGNDAADHSGISIRRGCIEFWWKAVDFGEWVAGLWYASNSSRSDRRDTDFGNAGPHVEFGWNSWDYGEGNLRSVDAYVSYDNQGGLATGLATRFSGDFVPGTWYHLAVAWDINGIPGDPDGHRIAIYRDGQKWSAVISDDRLTLSEAQDHYVPTVWFPGSRPTNFSTGGAYYYSLWGTYDNVKAWNYAKTDFSDRFTE